MYDTWYQYSAGILVLKKGKKSYFGKYVSVFLLDVSTIPPRSRDLRNTRFVFSWSHLDQVEKLRQFLRWAGAGDVARRDKTKEAHM